MFFRIQDPLVAHAHGADEDYVAVGQDVLKDGLVREGEAVLPFEMGLFGAAGAKIEGVMLDLELVAFGKPAAFLGRVRKCFIFRKGGIFQAARGGLSHQGTG